MTEETGKIWNMTASQKKIEFFEDDTSKLEERVSKLENKLDKLLKILEDKSD